MKAIIVTYVVMLLFVASAIESRSSLRNDKENALNHEEAVFWNRLLKQGASLSAEPAITNSDNPSDVPTTAPSEVPSDAPIAEVSEVPTTLPSRKPTIAPSETPTMPPSKSPSSAPSDTPTAFPSDVPTTQPSDTPTRLPSEQPTTVPSDAPTPTPSDEPSAIPSNDPTSLPSEVPTAIPSNVPTHIPSSLPSATPTIVPTSTPSTVPSSQPSLKPKPTKNPANADGLIPDPDKSCQVQAEVLCHQIANGKPCDAMQLQTVECYGELNSMKFIYEPIPCSQPENVCEDFGLLSNTLPSSIKCTDSDSTELKVTPSIVNPNATFQVQTINATTLPKVMKCLISNAALNVAQIVTVQQSKQNKRLEPAQKYGSLQLLDCSSKSCEREIFQEIAIYNTGENSVNVSNVTVYGNQGGVILPPPDKQLLPDQSITLNWTNTVSVCNVETYFTRLELEANDLQGESKCRAQANSTTNILPDCKVDVNMKCSVDNQDGLDCSDLTKPTAQCMCEKCVDHLVFRYTAARCSEPKPGNKRLASCIDRQNENITEASDAHIVITAGDRLLFNGIVAVGGNIVLDGNRECIGDTIDVLLAPPPGGSGILQNVRLDTSCKYGSDIALLESYGALILIGYACLDAEDNNCFVDVTYDFTAGNVGDVDFALSNFTLVTESTSNNLIQEVNATNLYLPQGTQYDVIAKETLNICAERPFKAKLQATGTTQASNATCHTDKNASVELQTECNTPSDMPSDRPSSIPSEIPSSIPSESPSNTAIVTPMSMMSSKSKKYVNKCMMSSKSKKGPPSPSTSSKYSPTASMRSVKTVSPSALPSTREDFDLPNGKGGKGYS